MALTGFSSVLHRVADTTRVELHGELDCASVPSLEGAMNGETFRAYIEQFVVPILKPNDIVAIDKLPAHNVAGIEEMINAVGATLRYLPKYSPDLNPSELPYSKFKAYLRKLAARTVPSLHRAIRSFLHILKPRECAHYYKHAGYAAI